MAIGYNRHHIRLITAIYAVSVDCTISAIVTVHSERTMADFAFLCNLKLITVVYSVCAYYYRVPQSQCWALNFIYALLFLLIFRQIVCLLQIT